MTDNATKERTASKTPSLIAYHIRERGSDESYWTRIGAAWAHADGKGFTIHIETVPLDGRITLRAPSEQ